MSEKKDLPLESSNLKSIDDISKKFKTKKDLSAEVVSLRSVVGAQELQNKLLLDSIDKKNKEIEHLKSLLSSQVPTVSGGLVTVDNEGMIAELQLQKLKQAAQSRDLTLEEARKFEIFSKVKQNANKVKPIEAKYSKLPDKIASTTLLQIAEGKKSKND